jgi:hypothetical protein
MLWNTFCITAEAPDFFKVQLALKLFLQVDIFALQLVSFSSDLRSSISRR